MIIPFQTHFFCERTLSSAMLARAGSLHWAVRDRYGLDAPRVDLLWILLQRIGSDLALLSSGFWVDLGSIWVDPAVVWTRIGFDPWSMWGHACVALWPIRGRSGSGMVSILAGAGWT